MTLYCMKQNALQKAKLSLPNTYWNYWIHSNNRWMLEEWGEDAFVPFREVPGFELAPADQYDANERGQLDMANCIRVYNNLREYITPMEASFEALWAGICNKTFYTSMRERWGYSKSKKYAPKAAGEIEARFFFTSRHGGGIYRNTIAKCWWIAHLLYDQGSADPYWQLKELGASNFSTKVTDIFKNYGFSRSKNVLRGIILGVQNCRRAGIPIDNASYCLRPALKHVNAVGGLILLDALREEDVAEILFEGALAATQGDSSKNLELCDEEDEEMIVDD